MTPPEKAERRPDQDQAANSAITADGISSSENTVSDRLQEARELTDRRSTSPEVRVAVRSAGQVRVQAGRTRIDLAPIDALELAGRLEQAAIHAERLPAPTTAGGSR